MLSLLLWFISGIDCCAVRGQGVLTSFLLQYGVFSFLSLSIFSPHIAPVVRGHCSPDSPSLMVTEEKLSVNVRAAASLLWLWTVSKQGFKPEAELLFLCTVTCWNVCCQSYLSTSVNVRDQQLINCLCQPMVPNASADVCFTLCYIGM